MILYLLSKNTSQAIQKVIMFAPDKELRRNAFDAFKKVRFLCLYISDLKLQMCNNPNCSDAQKSVTNYK